MVYMSVLHQSETNLKLLREPSFLSKTVFIGFLIGVVGVLIFGSESCCFKVLIGLVTVGLSCFMLDNYEVCEFDKKQGKVYLTRLHWFQYLFGQALSLGVQPYVVVKLEDIRDARIEEQGEDAGRKSFQVALSLYSGVKLGVTEVFTTDPVSEHEALAKKIVKFMNSSSPTLDKEEDDLIKDAGDEEKSSDDDDDDDFEQISKADIEGLEDDSAPGEMKPTE